MLLLLVVTLAILSYEGPPLLRERLWKELGVSGLITILAFGLALLQVQGIPLPSPTEATISMMKKLTHLSGLDQIFVVR